MANQHTNIANMKSQRQIFFELLRMHCHVDDFADEETFQEHNASAPLGGRGHN
jgi:hypothetical protein